MTCFRIASALSLLISLAVGATSATALNIELIDALWLTDRVDGTPIGNPFGIEIIVDLVDDVGLDHIEVVTPGAAGTFDLVPAGPLSWEPDVAVTTQFATSAALFTDFSVGTYRFNFLDSLDVVLDFFEITLNPVEVLDFLDVTDPIHNGTLSVTGDVDWLDCSACDGGRILGFALDQITDTDVDGFNTTDFSTVSWAPSGLVAGDDYVFEMILANYTNFQTSETTDGGDAFELLAGYESINAVVAMAVPEPGTAALLGVGLALLAVMRRRA